MEPGEELFILAFDHRGSFQSKWFGIDGEPTDDETLRIADGKELIFEGLELAPSKGAQAATAGGLVDEQFGAPKRIPDRIRAAGMKLAMPVEKSGQTEFDFQYGDEFGDHIERFDPDFIKVLVRYNPDGDPDLNGRQAERLARLSAWLAEHGRSFLFELLVPAEERAARLRGRRHRALRRRTASRADDPGDRPASGRRGRARGVEDRGHRSARGL